MEYPHRVSSSPYSFFDFQSDEEKLKEILSTNGIIYSQGHRFATLYKQWADKSEEVRSKGVTNVSALETLTILDLCEMHSIIEALPTIPKNILQSKWKRLLKGTVNRFEESHSNSVGRNTQFELLLYADLLKDGISCELCEDNPDILVDHQGIGVNIQCKRPLNTTVNSISHNIGEATRQLRADYKMNGNLGVIALCIERAFSGGNSFLQSSNQYSALQYVKQLHDEFNKKYRRCWGSQSVLGTSKIPLVILYTSTMAQLRDAKPPFAHVTERDSMETISSPDNRKNLRGINSVFYKTDGERG